MVQRVRVCGTIAAFDVQSDNLAELNTYLKNALLQAQLILRPIGNTVYLLPPYSITPEELVSAYTTIAAVLLAAFQSTALALMAFY